jgi:hypothetical protein
MTFTHGKHIVMTARGQRRLEVNTALSWKGKAPSIIPTILRITLQDCTLVHGFKCCRFCFRKTKENIYPDDTPLLYFMALITPNSSSEILKFIESPKSLLVKVNGRRLFRDLYWSGLDHTWYHSFWKDLSNTAYFLRSVNQKHLTNNNERCLCAFPVVHVCVNPQNSVPYRISLLQTNILDLHSSKIVISCSLSEDW